MKRYIRKNEVEQRYSSMNTRKWSYDEWVRYYLENGATLALAKNMAMDKVKNSNP